MWDGIGIPGRRPAFTNLRVLGERLCMRDSEKSKVAKT